jgi:hypothetical protein
MYILYHLKDDNTLTSFGRFSGQAKGSEYQAIEQPDQTDAAKNEKGCSGQRQAQDGYKDQITCLQQETGHKMCSSFLV